MDVLYKWNSGTRTEMMNKRMVFHIGIGTAGSALLLLAVGGSLSEGVRITVTLLGAWLLGSALKPFATKLVEKKGKGSEKD